MKNTFAQDLKTLMDAWDAAMAKVRAALPEATDDEVYQIVAREFNRKLGL